MRANRHQRRKRAAHERRRGAVARHSRPAAFRLAAGIAGVALVALAVLGLTTLRGERVPRAVLLLPVVGIGLLIAAVRG